MPLASEPGSRFYYSNMDAHLAMVALSRRVKDAMREFAREALFGPLGIEAFEWPEGSDGVPNGASERRCMSKNCNRALRRRTT